MARISRYRIGEEDIDNAIADLVEMAQGVKGNTDMVQEMITSTIRMARECNDRGDLKIANAALKEMRYAFNVFESYRDQKSAFSWWADKYITTQVNRAVVSQMERKHQKSGKPETKLNSISGTVYLTHELPLDPETIILDLEEKNMVTLAISELNDRDQKLINASISSEMGKIKKTAGQLNLTKPAAADRIKRLKKRITKTIRERI